MRDEISRLRGDRSDSNRSSSSLLDQGSEDMQRRRIEALVEDNDRLNNEVDLLRSQLALLLGGQRSSPEPVSFVGDMSTTQQVEEKAALS